MKNMVLLKEAIVAIVINYAKWREFIKRRLLVVKTKEKQNENKIKREKIQENVFNLNNIKYNYLNYNKFIEI